MEIPVKAGKIKLSNHRFNKLWRCSAKFVVVFYTIQRLWFHTQKKILTFLLTVNLKPVYKKPEINGSKIDALLEKANSLGKERQ